MTNRETNSRLTVRLLIVVAGMFGFGFALVPLYNVFCDITGLNGKTNSGRVAIEEMAVDPDRLVTVEFVASLNQNMPWDFEPAVAKMQVHPGQPYTTSYRATNRTDEGMIAHAVPSVAPGKAAKYFKKIECFCFTEQAFEPGEARDMPVQFVVDPRLPREVEVITLSYTFFEKGRVAGNTFDSPLEAVVAASQRVQ